jgi:hypothetical protein
LAIFGAGIDPEDDENTQIGQHIYALNITDGSVVYDFDDPAVTDTGNKKAYLSAAVAVFNSNVSLDYTDDKAFIGDTDGRLWRLDLNSEVLTKRLDFEDEDQAIVSAVSAAHAYGDNVWWDVVFVGSGGDTRSTGTFRSRLVGFIDEAYNLPYNPGYATISPSNSAPNDLPAPTAIDDPIDSFTPSDMVFMHLNLDDHEMSDAQPSTNIVETEDYSKLQTFFTLFNPGDDPCVVGTSRLLEVDHLISKSTGELTRVALPSGTSSLSLDLGTGKSGGTYVSDGVVFAPAGNKVSMFGKPVPPPPPKGSKAVVNILSWKVISD